MYTDGTTAVVAVIHEGRVFVANAGDSRSIIVQKGGRVRVMSIDHKPNRYLAMLLMCINTHVSDKCSISYSIRECPFSHAPSHSSLSNTYLPGILILNASLLLYIVLLYGIILCCSAGVGTRYSLCRDDEERRIRRLGGKVVHWGRWRVQGVLAVSRSVSLSVVHTIFVMIRTAEFCLCYVEGTVLPALLHF